MAANYSGPVQGTVSPVSSFDAEKDSEILRKAMKGLGTDEKAIIDIIGYRSNEQRQALKLQYKTMYGRDLLDDLKSELGGNFEDAVLALMMPSGHYDADQIHDAISGLGTDEETLIEIMCTRTNSQMFAVKQAYKTLYKTELEKDLVGDTSGDFRRLMVALSTAGRQENVPVDSDRATADAQALYKAGAAKLGTDEAKFNQILCSLSFPQLQATFEAYHKITGTPMQKAIESEFSGDIKSGLIAIVKAVENTPAYFAERLYKSMKGLGTNDKALIRLVVSRCEIDMVQIKQEFQKNYKKTLESFIEGDCSGDYKRILLALVK